MIYVSNVLYRLDIQSFIAFVNIFVCNLRVKINVGNGLNFERNINVITSNRVLV